MKKYILPLIFILLLSFTLIGNCAWLTDWHHRILLTIDQTKIGATDLTWFPVTVFLTATAGHEVFDELITDAEYLKVAFTKADGTTELYGEMELFDVSEKTAIFHVSATGWVISNTEDTIFYMYYDSTHADNVDYIGGIDTFGTPMGTLRPLVTFIFDDCKSTTYTRIKPLFAAQGEVACSATVTDWVGVTSYMTWSQILELQTAGWEILNHTETHPHLTELTEAQIRAEFEDSINDFATQGITTNNFVYPYTENNAFIKSIAQEYFRAARGNPLVVGVNPQIIDIYNLTDRCADDHTAIATYKADVDTAKSGNRWIMFYLHETDEDDEDMLNELIDYIQAQDVDIVTMEQALDIFERVNDRVGKNVWDTNFKTVHHMVDVTNATIKDSTSNFVDGIKTSANNPLETAGLAGQGQIFSTDKITTPGVYNDNKFTISFCVKPSNITNDQYIGGGSNDRRDVILGFQDNYFNVYNNGYPTGNAADTQILATVNTWQHIVYTTDGTNLLGYKNGAVVINVLANLNATGMGEYYFGSHYTDANPFAGILDEFRISNTNRSAGWIKATYNSLWNTLLTYGDEELSGWAHKWNTQNVTKWNGRVITKLNGLP